MQASPRLGLHLPEGTDQFTRQQFLDNFGWLDDSPGLFVCTSSSRPTTWGDNQVGRCILETDTGRVQRFNASHVFEPVLATDPQSAVNGAAITALQAQADDLQDQVDALPDTFVRGQNVSTVLGQNQTHTYTLSNFTNFRAGTFMFWTVCDFVLPTPVGLGTYVYVKTELLIDGTDATGTYGDPYVEDGAYKGVAGLESQGNTRRQIVGLGYRTLAAAGSHTIAIRVSTQGGSNSQVTVDHIRAFGMLGAG